MATNMHEVMWLHAQDVVDEHDLGRMLGMSQAELDELVEYGTLVPLPGAAAPLRVFSAGCVPQLREAFRLRADFDLDLFTVSLLAGYLQRIAELERRLRGLEAHLPQPLQPAREGPELWREPHG
jgi:chaperone modulatory protein CbpM